MRARRAARDAFNDEDRRFHLRGPMPSNFVLAPNADLSTIPVSDDPKLCELFTGFHKNSHDRYSFYVTISTIIICAKQW
jgi:hypothetical protein